MNGPTVQQVKDSAPEDFWHYLAQLPGTVEAEILYALLLAGAMGMFANCVQKWARGELVGGPVDYFFCHNKRGTVLSLCGMIGLAITVVQSGISFTDGHFVGWANVLWIGASNGFAADAVANRGKRPEWTDEQRAAKAENPPVPSAVMPVTTEKKP